MTKDKVIYIGSAKDSPIPYEVLEERLKANAKLQAEKELYLHADRTLDYGFVIDVMAKLRRAGVEKLGMVTDPLEGGQ